MKQFPTLFLSLRSVDGLNFAGAYVIQKIKEDLTYDYLNSSEENLWSILYLTGYLTRIRAKLPEQPLLSGSLALTIPNAEVMEIFRTTIAAWFEDNSRQMDRRKYAEYYSQTICYGISFYKKRCLVKQK